MSGHLLLLTVGPVQEFISQARRTRDLWYGSHVLSELARAVCRSLVDDGAHLVVPALEKGDPELELCRSPLRSGGYPPLGIPNRVLAELPAGLDPRVLACRTRDALQLFWRTEIADPVRRRCRGLLAEGIDSVWDEQVDTFLEVTAAWAPLHHYDEARADVESAVAGRKNLRDFRQWRTLRGPVPKSSLDGGRETVLRVSGRPDDLVGRYRIADREELDAIGLIKRAGGDPEQFPPVVNVATASWVARAAQTLPLELRALSGACQELGVPPVRRSDLVWTQDLPFDASLLFPSQWAAVFRAQNLHGSPVAWGERYVRPLLHVLGEPYPYVACLHADGDHMGSVVARLAAAGGIEAHRGLARTLADFTREARRIVEVDHSGSLVYCGGDDVLAFVPVPQAVPCASALRSRFEDLTAGYSSRLPSQDRPTLSVGIGIGHIMESMGDTLGLGREALGLAKSAGPMAQSPERNALAVIVEKRGGSRCSWRTPWTDWGGDPAARLAADASLLGTRLSTRRLHTVVARLQSMPHPDVTGGVEWARVLVGEVSRALSDPEGEGPVTLGEAGLVLDEAPGYARVRNEVSMWTGRLLVARTLWQAAPKSRHLNWETDK